MLYTVEVRLIGGDLITSMSHMRTWLDHRRIEPDAFRHSAGGAGITFRVDFKREDEALAFARVFGGRLIGVPAPNERQPVPWSSSIRTKDLTASAQALETAPSAPPRG
jgi:hypothetical protein